MDTSSRLVTTAVATAIVLLLGHVWMSLTTFTYAKVHLFILAPVALLYSLPPHPLGDVHPNVRRFGYTILAVLCVIAVVYSVLGWDHILYRDGIVTCSSSYGSLNGVPMEEWFWCIDHTLLASFWVMSIWRSHPVSLTRGSAQVTFRAATTGACLAMAYYGYYLQGQDKSFRYLGIALLHTFPILAAQLALTGPSYLRCYRESIFGIVVPSMYVIAVDTYAINKGLWEVTPDFATGYYFFGIRIEHIVIYTLTTALASQTIVGFLRYAEIYQVLRKRTGSTLEALALTFVWE